MKAIIQRCRRASVAVDGQTVGAIEHGLAIFLGVAQGDDEATAARLARKVAELRIFDNAAGRFDLALREVGAMLEVVCNESETGQRHYSGNLDQAQTKVVEVPEDILRRYVGTYRGIWLGNTITAVVTLEDGELHLTRTPRYSDTGGNTDSDTSRLIPQSENAFDSSFGLGWVFNVDENGEVESVSEVHVSGAWAFPRVAP